MPCRLPGSAERTFLAWEPKLQEDGVSARVGRTESRPIISRKRSSELERAHLPIGGRKVQEDWQARKRRG